MKCCRGKYVVFRDLDGVRIFYVSSKFCYEVVTDEIIANFGSCINISTLLFLVKKSICSAIIGKKKSYVAIMCKSKIQF